MSSSPTDEGKFLDWFKEKGGTVHRAVAFKQFEGMGRGCVALEDIEVSSALPDGLRRLREVWVGL